MIDIKDFLKNFGSKEEMLGAYVEGNLSPEEEKIVDNLLDQDPGLMENFDDLCVELAYNITDQVFNFSETDMEEINSYRDDFKINELLDNNLDNDTMTNYENFNDNELATNGKELHYNTDETAESVDEIATVNLENSNSATTLKHTQAIGPMQVGEAPIDEYSPYVKQGYSDTCAINCQRIILNAFGNNITEEELRNQAIENGLYREGYGTSLNDMGGLLRINNCPCTNYICGNVADLTRALAEGKMVMMAVDSGELWKESFLGKLWEKIEDNLLFVGGPDHAILVTGIDARNPEDVKVIVTDPGSGDLNKPYPIDQFIDAAKDSRFYMTITDNPRPDAFDAYNIPNMSHLPAIGGLNYHQFIENYQPYFSLGNIELYENGAFDQLIDEIKGEDYQENIDSATDLTHKTPHFDSDDNQKEEDINNSEEDENNESENSEESYEDFDEEDDREEYYKDDEDNEEECEDTLDEDIEDNNNNFEFN